jgi:hypothetical protein
MKTTTTSKHPIVSVRLAGVPLVAWETADPAATITAFAGALNGKIPPILQWDCIRGLNPVTRGRAAELAADIGEPIETQNLAQCLQLIGDKYRPESENDEAEPGAIFVLHQAGRALDDPTVIQGVWNLRDQFKAVGATLVLLGPAIKLPPELSADIPIFEEPIPTREQVDTVITSLVSDAAIPAPNDEERARVHDTLTGYLSIFAIEQSLALAVTPRGLDIPRLWQLKVSSLKNTAGLEISQPDTGFESLAGCEGIKSFLTLLLNGRERPRGVFFLDEIEKMVSGASGGDLSGTTQAMVEQFLYWTEARKVLAVLLLGVPGGGKSWTAQCTAGEAKIPLLRGSMSTVKGSLVGQSEQNMRQLLKTVDSVTGSKTLLLATCNSLDTLTPELIARFKLGVFFYDYPTAEESAALWELYLKRYELPQQIPAGTSNWVGREIESCCHRAWLFNCSVAEAARSVVPVSRANATKMDALRRSASGRFLSAARPGIFDAAERPIAAPATGRKFNTATT